MIRSTLDLAAAALALTALAAGAADGPEVFKAFLQYLKERLPGSRS